MTPAIHLHVLASGSKGNAAVVEGPDGMVLVDCGLSRRELLRRAAGLGLDLGAVRAVVLTHEHSDHASGIPVLSRHLRAEFVATAGTVAARASLSEVGFRIVSDDEGLELAGMRVRAFPTSHDVADPIGLRFEAEGDALGYCTDTGVLTDAAREALADVRVLALEANHDEGMLRRGPYPAFLKARVAGAGGHLSNAQAAEALPDLVGERTEVVVAMHLSQENNRPSTCVRALAGAVGARPVGEVGCEARTPDGRLTIVPAGQDRPMTVW